MKKFMACITALIISILIIGCFQFAVSNDSLKSADIGTWVNPYKYTSLAGITANLDKNTMPIFGSSEFNHPKKSKYHPRVVFRNQQLTPMLLGTRFSQSMVQAITLASIEPHMKLRKAVILVSPTWFTGHAASVIMSESDKMSALVEEILSLSRLESGETEMNPESISISEIVNDCLVALETVVIKRGLVIETHLEDDKVLADPAQAETAVSNIISNAVKYAMHRIVIRNDDKSLSVWNDGGNLSRENLEHIFDRFYIGEKGQTGIGMLNEYGF